MTDVLIIIATICCSPVSDRTLERNLIWSKLWLFTRGALSYSALDLQQSEALETLGVVAVTSKIFSLWPPPTASTARSLVLVLVLVLCHRPPPPVLHAARRASLVQSYFSDGTRCAAFRGLLIKVQFICWNITTKQNILIIVTILIAAINLTLVGALCTL